MKSVIVSSSAQELSVASTRALPSGVHARPLAASEVDPAHLMASVFLDGADPVVLEGPSGAVIQANAAFEQLVGVRADALVGQSLSAFVAERDREHLQAVAQQCRGGEDKRGVEITLFDADGAVHCMLLTASLLTDVEGEALAISYHFMEVGHVHERLSESDRMAHAASVACKAAQERLELVREQAARAQAKVQRLESLLIAQQSISAALAENASFDHALAGLLRSVCAVGGFKAGEFWRIEVTEDALVALRQGMFTVPAFEANLARVLGRDALVIPSTSETDSGGRVSALQLKLVLCELMSVAGLGGIGVQRVLVFEVRARERTLGVLRFLGEQQEVESSLCRMLEQVAQQWGAFLAADRGI